MNSNKKREMFVNTKLSARDRLEENNHVSSTIENKNFIEAFETDEVVGGGSNSKLFDAENDYMKLKKQLEFTGKETVEEVKNKYDEKIQQWNELHKQTINEYKKTIKKIQDEKSNCPDMNEYIHKKKIPCWGCQL
jgi:hypothetical protein